MQSTPAMEQFGLARWHLWTAWIVLMCISGPAAAEPFVEFDFARTAECRDVTSVPSAQPHKNSRLVEFVLPMSVRFHGLTADDVEELDIEINAAAAGLRVVAFAPTTQLASDVAKPIETTTTTTRARSLDATLGGELPLPYADVVAHVAPSINAGISGSKTAVEKMNRLPPKYAIVVSGTSSEGRGVFYKLKRSSQTSLEGLHELSVTFVVPADWRGGDVRVGCRARGTRKLLWFKQSAIVGHAAATLRLYPPGRTPVYHVAKPLVAHSADAGRPASFLAAAAAEVSELLSGVSDATTPAAD
jgi:hypothetical protein